MLRRRAGPALAGAALLVAACGSGRGGAASTTSVVGAPTAPAARPGETPVATTVAPTTTTVDPGSLPQTRQLPSAADRAFVARMAGLLRAVQGGDPAVARPAFFPLRAYVQVKGISDPVHDYQTRLLADYDQDIRSLHEELAPDGRPLELDRVAVPDAPEWILPGVEYNKGSYWRVYDSRLYFRSAGEERYLTIASLISWRGQWYVVHLNSIR